MRREMRKRRTSATCHAVDEDIVALLHMLLNEVHCSLQVLHRRLGVINRGQVELLNALRVARRNGAIIRQEAEEERKRRASPPPCRRLEGHRLRRTCSPLSPSAAEMRGEEMREQRAEGRERGGGVPARMRMPQRRW